MKNASGLFRVTVLIAVMLGLAGLQPVDAGSLSPQNTILVNTTLDQYDTDASHCSLREAIQ